MYAGGGGYGVTGPEGLLLVTECNGSRSLRSLSDDRQKGNLKSDEQSFTYLDFSLMGEAGFSRPHARKSLLNALE